MILTYYLLKQFFITGFSTPFRKDRNSNGDRLLLYVRDDIPTMLLKTFNAPGDFEGFFVELNLERRNHALTILIKTL